MEIGKTARKLRVLVVGAGMYVAGRGTPAYGTVLPALNELYREGLVERIYAAATCAESIRELGRKAASLRRVTGTDMEIAGFPKKGKNPAAYNEVLAREKPDCAIIVTPDHLHFRIAADLIKAGVHCLVVKPLTPGLAEAKKLVKLAEDNQIYAAVEFHKRFDEANLKLQDVLKGGKIGDILYIQVEFSQRRIIPLKVFRSWIGHTNIFQYLGVHYVDIINFVTRAKPLRVLATGQKKLLTRLGIDSYDSIQALVEWEGPGRSRFISSILTNWIDPNTTSAMSDQAIKVIGTAGRFESDQKHRGVRLVTEREGIEEINPYFTQGYSWSGDNLKLFKGYGIESIKQFGKDVLSIKNGVNVPSDFQNRRPTFKEALISTAVIEAVNRSLKENSSWVNLKW